MLTDVSVQVLVPRHMNVADTKVSCYFGDDRLEDE